MISIDVQSVLIGAFIMALIFAGYKIGVYMTENKIKDEKKKKNV